MFRLPWRSGIVAALGVVVALYGWTEKEEKQSPNRGSPQATSHKSEQQSDRSPRPKSGAGFNRSKHTVDDIDKLLQQHQRLIRAAMRPGPVKMKPLIIEWTTTKKIVITRVKVTIRDILWLVIRRIYHNLFGNK